MSPFPKLRPSLWDALVVLAVVLLAAVCSLAFWRGRDGGALAVVVSVDGETVDRFPPSDLLKEPRTYENNGYTLRLAYAAVGGNGQSAQPASGEIGVCVAEADCPTLDCVHTGVISRSGQSIVCLPARIIIQLEGGTAAEDAAVDAVTG